MFSRKVPWERASIVAAAYVALTVLLTWPLVTVMNRRITQDMGDPLFNSWVLLWTSGQLLRALGGDWSALAHYWNANIFYPAPLTLAYSEHLTPQMLQALPVVAVTHNALLAYNLLHLSNYVLSGLGMYLLVRELTDRPLAAFLAGLAFAFTPYRLDQYGHLEVLSSQWMPFTLYGLRRYFVTGRLRPLIGGVAALVVQGLSCGYYLAYFPPFVVAYCLCEMVARGRLGDARTWRALLLAGTAALLVVAVFLWPYLRVRQLGDVGVRGATELSEYSADTHAFATVSDHSTLWGRAVRAMPRTENQGFQGFAPMVFALAAIAAAAAAAVRRVRTLPLAVARWRSALAIVLAVLMMALVLVLLGILVAGRAPVWAVALLLRKASAIRAVFAIAAVTLALAAVSPRVRWTLRGVPGSLTAFFAWAALAAAWMSLGPVMHANTLDVGPGLYAVFYRWVPLFNGLRVTALYFMLVALFLSVLAGLGAATVLARWPRAGRVAVAFGALLIVAESWSLPTETNLRPQVPGYRRPPPELSRVPDLDPAYRVIRDLPPGTVVAEFPFGEVGFETIYTFYAGYHRQKLLNGYSGFFPAHYQRLVEHLSHVPRDPEGWAALAASGATHALVHEGSFLDDEGVRVSAWLRSHGARGVFRDLGDVVFQLR